MTKGRERFKEIEELIIDSDAILSYGKFNFCFLIQEFYGSATHMITISLKLMMTISTIMLVASIVLYHLCECKVKSDRL